MTREEAIEVYHGLISTKIKEAFEFFAPELAESEDERIRKDLVNFLQSPFIKGELTDERVAPWLAYLEKQKDKMTAEEYEKSELFQLKLKTKYANGYQDGLAQKEQKPQGVYVDCTEHPEWYGMPPKEQKPADLPAGFYVTLPDGKKYYTKEMRCKGMNIKVVEPKPIAWSKEDEEIANTILNLLCSQVTYVTGQGTTSGKQFPTYPKERDWFEKRFKSLRPQPKQEWSEEDRMMIDHLIEALPMWANGLIAMLPSQAEEYVERLKSLRPSSKPSDVCYGAKGDPDPAGVWKPSEEQMEALRVTLDFMPDTFKPKCTLMTLQHDLEKLI